MARPPRGEPALHARKAGRGALVDQQPVPILENDTALEVSMKVADAAQQVLARSLPKLIAGSAAARALDLAQGSYFGRRRPQDGRIDWHSSARQIHDLVRAVAPPFPGAFTVVNGMRLEVLETRVEPGPLRHPERAPCLYVDGGDWYADCADDKRLKILKLAAGPRPIARTPHPRPCRNNRSLSREFARTAT